MMELKEDFDSASTSCFADWCLDPGTLVSCHSLVLTFTFSFCFFCKHSRPHTEIHTVRYSKSVHVAALEGENNKVLPYRTLCWNSNDCFIIFFEILF